MISAKKGLFSRAGRITPAILFLFIFLALPSYAYESFERVSGVNQTFSGDNIRLDNNNELLTTRSHLGFSNLVSDLNNDSVNEILIFDIQSASETTWTLFAYQGRSLTAVDSINLNITNNGFISNFEIIDIDDDGFKEIWYADSGDTGCIKAISMNATNEFNVFRIDCSQSISSGSATTFVLGCDDSQNICALARAKQTFFDEHMRLHYFNATEISSVSPLLFDDTGVNDGNCISNIRHLPFGNFNPNNGDRLEVVTSYMIADGGVEACFAVGSVDLFNLSDSTTDVDTCVATGSSHITDAQPECIDDEYSFMVSPPLVKDLNGFPSDGSEVVVAVTTGDEEFKMFSWKIDGTFLDDFPETSEAQGRYVSSIFPANALDSSGLDDFCVLGFNVPTGENPQLLCGSELNTASTFWFFSAESITLDYPVNSPNITPSYYNVPNIVFGVEHNAGNVFTEVLSTHGIHSLATNVNALYSATFTGGWVLPSDAEDVGWDDLIVGASNTIVYYIDDAFTNSNCEDDGCITEIFTNPCVLEGDILKNNTQLQVRVSAVDIDGDDVNFRVSVYDTDPFEQNQSQLNQSSGSTIPFLFTLFNETNNAVLKVEVWDTENPTKIEEVTYTFIVAGQGSEFGDVVCTADFEVISAVEEDDLALLPDLLDTSFSGIETAFGLARVTVWYMFLLMFLAFMTWELFNNRSQMLGGIVISFIVSFAWMFLGVSIGFVPFAHLLVILLILALGLGLMVAVLFGFGRATGD